MDLKIENMTCGGCAKAVAKAIMSVDPNARIQTDPPGRRVSVETSAELAALREALEEAGYPVTADGERAVS